MENQTIEETYAIMYICGMLECVKEDLASLPDSDNKLELVKWLNVSTEMLKFVTCDGYSVAEPEIDENVDVTTVS